MSAIVTSIFILCSYCNKVQCVFELNMWDLCFCICQNQLHEFGPMSCDFSIVSNKWGK